jgi:hypothetical protein
MHIATATMVLLQYAVENLPLSTNVSVFVI